VPAAGGVLQVSYHHQEEGEPDGKGLVEDGVLGDRDRCHQGAREEAYQVTTYDVR
jgi:hypothetical protein